MHVKQEKYSQFESIDIRHETKTFIHPTVGKFTKKTLREANYVYKTVKLVFAWAAN